MTAQTVEVLSLLAVSVYTDVKYRKIKNIFILIYILISFVTNIYFKGIPGLYKPFIGLLVPTIILLLLYVLRMLGAGDIKLFAAIGAIWGITNVLWSIIYSFIAGGIIGVIILAICKNSKERFHYLFTYFKSCFLSRKLLEYQDFSSNVNGGSFRFTYAIVPGVIAQMIISFYFGGM